jgi:hypothetical protein
VTRPPLPPVGSVDHPSAGGYHGLLSAPWDVPPAGGGYTVTVDLPPPGDALPLPLTDLADRDDDGSELGWLRLASDRGVPVAPIVVVPARVESDFYRWNHLAPRWTQLLSAVDPRDPDEDDLDELLPRAAAWVMEHALLEGAVDAFYAALSGLPARLTVRRPATEGLLAPRGRPALLALKRTWAAEWEVAAVLDRVAAGVGWLPPARPVLVHGAELRHDPQASAAASTVLGRPVSAWSDDEGRIARLAPA